MRVAVLAHLEDPDDVGVVDGCGETGFSTEALHVAPVSRKAGVEHLEGDDLARLGVEGAVDGALAA